MEKSLKKYFWVFAGPTLICFIAVLVVPFIYGIVLSFAEFRSITGLTITGLTRTGFDNYVRAFSDTDFLNALWFSARYTVISAVLTNLIAFALALMLSRGVKGTSLYRTLIFMPNLIGGIVLGYILRFIINGALSAIGAAITVDAGYGFWGLVILNNWQFTGCMMIIYIAGIQNISTDILEAAKIDGAGAWTTLTKITIPLVMPSITIAFFMSAANSFRMFDQNLALTTGLPGKETVGAALDVYNTFYGRPGLEGVGQAKAVVFFIIAALISFAQLSMTRKREVEN
ncbi:MAG: sugar ABC transporter permease [Spirochaetaceae bacterium]|jgi:raffinose/stachyose/melibiose transport system permease protein|nr:sugar ABC transporter permease [Spirochaetaceae bacterium]